MTSACNSATSNTTSYPVKAMINKHLLMASFRQTDTTHGAQVSLRLPTQVQIDIYSKFMR